MKSVLRQFGSGQGKSGVKRPTEPLPSPRVALSEPLPTFHSSPHPDTNIAHLTDLDYLHDILLVEVLVIVSRCAVQSDALDQGSITERLEVEQDHDGDESVGKK